jgi:ABC-type antimicrobial peptide transport system ATPase subunit
MSNAVNRSSFLLNSNRTHGGVQNKGSGQSAIAKIDVIEGAGAYQRSSKETQFTYHRALCFDLVTHL